MHPSLLWLMVTAWPLEDEANRKLSAKEQAEWKTFYDRAAKSIGIYHPVIQTCWY